VPHHQNVIAAPEFTYPIRQGSLDALNVGHKTASCDNDPGNTIIQLSLQPFSAGHKETDHVVSIYKKRLINFFYGTTHIIITLVNNQQIENFHTLYM
jgi:hypothetical protein